MPNARSEMDIPRYESRGSLRFLLDYLAGFHCDNPARPVVGPYTTMRDWLESSVVLDS